MSSKVAVVVKEVRDNSPLVLISVIPLLRPELSSRLPRPPFQSQVLPADPPKQGRERGPHDTVLISRTGGGTFLAVTIVADNSPSVQLCEGKGSHPNPGSTFSQSNKVS